MVILEYLRVSAEIVIFHILL